MKLFRTPRFFRILFPNKTWVFSRLEKTVYLTFDDGPSPEITPWVLDLLKENGIQATFFCVGENVKNHPMIFERIVQEGHLVGNHSMNHNKGTKTSLKEYLNSVDSAKEYIDSSLFRPPYGRISLTQTRALRKKYQIVMWSWLSYDFDRSVPIETIFKKAKSQIKSGDILVLHDNPKIADRLKVLLPELITLIREKKLEFNVIPRY